MNYRKDRMVSLAMAIALAAASAVMLARPAALASPADDKITAAQALDLQKKFEAAQIAGDAATVGSLMADDAMFVHGNMRVQTKAEFVAGVGKGGPNNFEGADRKVVLFNSGALVTGPVTISLAMPAAAAEPHLRRELHIYLSTLWVHTAAGWQEILSQTTEVTPLRRERPRDDSCQKARVSSRATNGSGILPPRGQASVVPTAMRLHEERFASLALAVTPRTKKV